MFSTAWGVNFGPPGFMSIVASDGAWRSCSTAPVVAPANAEMTARFITDTSVSYEGGASATQPTTSSANTQSTSSINQISSPRSTSGPASVATQTPPTSTMSAVTSTHLSTVVTSGPSGPVTFTNTMEVISVVVVSMPSSTGAGEGSSPSPSVSSNTAGRYGTGLWMWMAVTSGYLMLRCL